MKSAVLNACTLALVHAGMNFKDLPFACDAKIVNGIVVAGTNYSMKYQSHSWDPNEQERGMTGPIMSVVLWVHSNKVVTMQMARPLSIDDHEKLLAMACTGTLLMQYIYSARWKTNWEFGTKRSEIKFKWMFHKFIVYRLLNYQKIQ